MCKRDRLLLKSRGRFQLNKVCLCGYVAKFTCPVLSQLCQIVKFTLIPIWVFCQEAFTYLPTPLCQIVKFTLIPIWVFCQEAFTHLPTPLCQIVKSTLLPIWVFCQEAFYPFADSTLPNCEVHLTTHLGILSRRLYPFADSTLPICLIPPYYPFGCFVKRPLRICQLHFAKLQSPHYHVCFPSPQLHNVIWLFCQIANSTSPCELPNMSIKLPNNFWVV
jgi:hypothetical protein